MRRKLALVLAIVMVVTVFIAGCGSTPAETPAADAPAADAPATDTPAADLPKIELSLALHDPVTSRMATAMQEWADDVNARTNGGLTITLYGSGTLCPGNEALNFVMDGAADMGWLFTMYFPGQFPLSEVTTLPMIGAVHSAQVAETLWDLYEYSPEMREEVDSKIHVLQMYSNPANIIATSTKPVDSVDNIQGLKIRTAAGNITEVAKLWGASPENVPVGEIYDALEKGNIQGCVWDWHGLEAFKVYENLTYYPDNMYTHSGVYMLGMNIAKWESLPQEYKDVLTETTGREGSVAIGNIYYEAEQGAKANILAIDKDAVLVTVPDEEIAAFKEVADEFALTWADKYSTDTFDAHAYLEKARELLEQHKR